MIRGFLGLGSNLGDKHGHLKAALAALAREPGIEVRRTARYYRTAPMGPVDQDWFLNTVIEIGTTLVPEQLLARCLLIEASLGRVRQNHWGPRTIDLDILWLDDCVIQTEQLKLPHPGARLRSFVLVPWCELAPDLRLDGQTLKYWAALADPLAIEVVS